MTTPWVVAFVLLWFVVVLAIVVLLGFLRRVSEVLERSAAAVSVDDLAIGAPLLSVIRPFEVSDADGVRYPFPGFVQGHALILFIGTDCPACDMLLEQMADVGASVDDMPLFVIGEGAGEHEWRTGAPPGLHVLYQRDGEATEAFDNRATPQAYVVDEHGVVLERRVPGSLAHLRDMAMHQRAKGGESHTNHAAEDGAAVAAHRLEW